MGPAHHLHPAASRRTRGECCCPLLPPLLLQLLRLQPLPQVLLPPLLPPLGRRCCLPILLAGPRCRVCCKPMNKRSVVTMQQCNARPCIRTAARPRLPIGTPSLPLPPSSSPPFPSTQFMTDERGKLVVLGSGGQAVVYLARMQDHNLIAAKVRAARVGGPCCTGGGGGTPLACEVLVAAVRGAGCRGVVGARGVVMPVSDRQLDGLRRGAPPRQPVLQRRV